LSKSNHFERLSESRGTELYRIVNAFSETEKQLIQCQNNMIGQSDKNSGAPNEG